MRQNRLEDDMVSEQKDLLGYLSYREAIYSGVGILILYAFVPMLFKFGKWIGGLVVGLIIPIFIIIPVVLAVYFIAFSKHPKTGYTRDKHYFILFQNRFEYGIWRGGSSRTMKTLKELKDEE